MSTKSVVMLCGIVVYALVVCFGAITLRRLDEIKREVTGRCGSATVEQIETATALAEKSVVGDFGTGVVVTATEGFGAVDAGDQMSKASEASEQGATFHYNNVRLDSLEKLCKEFPGQGQLLKGSGNSVICVIPGMEGNAFYTEKLQACIVAGGGFLGQTPGLDLLCDMSTVGL